ncbi:MAG: hypothetical protein NW237_03625 [Cyanobacteriota bacterium]|nr:hypothetical protein [Cyanobacteriota bacterium]
MNHGVLCLIVIIFAAGSLGLAAVDPEYRPRFADLAQMGLSGFLGYLVPSPLAKKKDEKGVGE